MQLINLIKSYPPYVHYLAIIIVILVAIFVLVIILETPRHDIELSKNIITKESTEKSITPENIYKSINEQPLTQKEIFAKIYEGQHIKWSLYISEIFTSKENNNIVKIVLIYKPNLPFPIITTQASMDKYPFLKLAKEKQIITIEADIAHANEYEIYLKNSTLTIEGQ